MHQAELLIIRWNSIQIYTDTYQWKAVFSCAGNWWWVSWLRPCPGWSWHCGAGAAAGPARKTPLTPSHADIVLHPLISPSCALSSLCWTKVVDQPQLWHIPGLLCTLLDLTSLLSTAYSVYRMLRQLESATSNLTAKPPSRPPSDSFTCIAICKHLIGCWPKETESSHSKWLARRIVIDSPVSWCTAKLQCNINHHDVYKRGSTNLWGREMTIPAPTQGKHTSTLTQWHTASDLHLPGLTNDHSFFHLC